MIERYWKVYYSNRLMFKTELIMDLTVSQAIQLDRQFREKFPIISGYAVEHAYREYLPWHIKVE